MKGIQYNTMICWEERGGCLHNWFPFTYFYKKYYSPEPQIWLLFTFIILYISFHSQFYFTSAYSPNIYFSSMFSRKKTAPSIIHLPTGALNGRYSTCNIHTAYAFYLLCMRVVHPVAKWVTGMWTKVAWCLFTLPLMAALTCIISTYPAVSCFRIDDFFLVSSS